MDNRRQLSFLLAAPLLWLGLVLPERVLAQETAPAAPSFVRARDNLTAEQRLHAFALTRFHFTALKRFQSNLFSRGPSKWGLADSGARLANSGLDAFLVSAERETALLTALREDKAVRIRFFVPGQLRGPTRVKQAPATIEVRPLVNGPIAFQITVEDGNERHVYDVNWAGWISGFPWRE